MLHFNREQVHCDPEHAVVGVAREELDAVAADVVDEIMQLASAPDLQDGR